MKNKNFLFLVLLSSFFPIISSAQQLQRTETLFESALSIVGNILIPLVFILALLFFFWGVAKYIKSEGDGKAEGKSVMIWGVVALFVMSAIWGLVAFIQTDVIGVGDTGPKVVPGVIY